MIVGIEMIEEAAGGKAFSGFGLLAMPGNGKTDDNPAEHGQHQCGVGRSDSGAIFIKDVIQAIVELAFDGPILAFDGFEVVARGFVCGKAGEQEHGFLAFLVLAQNHPCDGGDLTGRGEPDLFRVGRLAATDIA